MKVPINRSVNIFHRNLKKINDNKEKKVKLITENDTKINNNEMRTKNSNNLNYLKMKTFLNENENDNESDNINDDNENENKLNMKINRLTSNKKYNKSILKVKLSKSICNTKEYFSPKIKPKVNFIKKVKNRQRKNTFTLNNKEEFDKNKKNNSEDIDLNNSQYFKFRRKECKSSTIDAFKKRYLLYKENNLAKKQEIQKKRTFMKDNINIKLIKDIDYKTFDIRKNNILNYFKITQENNNNQRNINAYNEKFLIKTPKNEIMNNNIIQNRNIYLYTEKNSNIVYNDKNNKYKKLKTIHSTNLNYPEENQETKISPNLILDLPNINTDRINSNSQKNFSFKIEKKKRQVHPLKSLFDKSDKKIKKALPKKTTTINIYNNKINNINNIIVNDKNVKKHIKKDDESQLSKSSNIINSFNINKTHNKESKKEKMTYKEDLNLKLISSNETKYSNDKNKINEFELSEKNNQINHLKDCKIKMWMNYTKKFLNQFQSLRKKGENINQMEKNIRDKILNANSIYEDSKIKNNLKKIKKETTLKLFQELSKKISYDIENGEKNYKNKDSIKLDENFINNEKSEYTKKVEKKTVKIIKQLNKFHFVTKNKLIQVYERNISHYRKINNNENKYFFYKYLLNNYFEYISCIIYGKKNAHKEIKRYNLLNIYNINRNKNNYANSVSSNLSRRKDNYFYSKFLQYLLMEKDKIQKYTLNDKYVDKTIIQIKTLLRQANKEINDKNIDSNKINFIINNNENEIKNNLSNDKNNILKVSFLDLKKKSEYSDTDKYDSKSGYDTRGIFPGKITFNYKSKNSILDNDNKDEDKNKLVLNKKNILLKKKTYNSEMLNTNFLNSINNSSGKNLNKLSNNNLNLDIEKKYDLSIVDKYKIEDKYIQNFTKNKDYFYKRKKLKSKKKQEILKQKKELDFLKGNIMFKNMIDYRTDEIKAKMKKKIKSPVEMLFYHIKEHDFDEFCDLFERKQIDLNARNQDKDSFLTYAVKCRAINFVSYLLKRGINVNLENKYGNTALHYAFMDQNYELADILLQHEADEFKTNIFGKTPWQCLGEKN